MASCKVAEDLQRISGHKLFEKRRALFTEWPWHTEKPASNFVEKGAVQKPQVLRDFLDSEEPRVEPRASASRGPKLANIWTIQPSTVVPVQAAEKMCFLIRPLSRLRFSSVRAVVRAAVGAVALTLIASPI